MKKMIFLSMFALGALTINAQTAVVESGGFWDNWSMGIQGGATMKMSGTGFFKSARPAFGLTIGKQWTPILGTDIQGMGYVNTTNSSTMIDASEVSLIARMNLMNLFGTYDGMPNAFEIETVTGLGWLHHYMNGAGDTDDLSARVGLNFNFNLGDDAAWTFGIKPAVVFNLTGDYPSKKMAFNRNHANMEILLGFTYHFADTDGNRHFAMVNAVDPMALAAMNEEINGLREIVAAKDVELVGLADELLIVQNQLNEARAKQASAKGDTINIVESVVAFRFNQSDVEASQMASIEHVANYLKDNPDVNVTINGYASPEGTEEYNLKLSQRRADAVKKILVDKYGIASTRINTIGHGVGDIFSEPAWNRVGICTIDEMK
ncbi:MAG: OmpA family protein [Bacteroidaceae bacterium]|nr:OmpA family protein [Bacteroidaceae bacterium]